MIKPGIAVIVPGLDGEPITTLDAAFLPDATTLIVHAFDQSLLRVELFSSPSSAALVHCRR